MAPTAYEPVIGFEIHVELSTATKVWCGCPTTFGGPPNTHVCPVCLGMPGVLPVLNKRAFDYSLRAATALNCAIPDRATFDRKNYYYPDLPKNYQISQQYAPIGGPGYVDIEVPNPADPKAAPANKRIRINNVHLEEDAGKLLHPDDFGADYSLVDLNRAGTPLLEIVSEPDITSMDEAAAYMATMKNLLEYIEVSDCKMEEGRLRFEVNISMRPAGSTTLGTKVEIKNLNSMKVALKCIEHESRRQAKLLADGGRVVSETRLWDEDASATRAMRGKEGANDYRYFPDPDLVEIIITKEIRDEVARNLPELQDAKRRRFATEHGLPDYDARVLTASKPVATYYEQAVAAHNSPKAISNWMMTEVLRELKVRGADAEPNELPLGPEDLGSLVRMIDEGKISGKVAKDVFAKSMGGLGHPEDIVRQEGLAQVSDTSAIEQYVDEALAENPDIVEKVKAGQTKSLQALVGQIMKKSRGKANPTLVNELLAKKLGL